MQTCVYSLDGNTDSGSILKVRTKLSCSCKAMSSSLDNQKMSLSRGSCPSSVLTISLLRCSIRLQHRPGSSDNRIVPSQPHNKESLLQHYKCLPHLCIRLKFTNIRICHNSDINAASPYLHDLHREIACHSRSVEH